MASSEWKDMGAAFATAQADNNSGIKKELIREVHMRYKSPISNKQYSVLIQKYVHNEEEVFEVIALWGKTNHAPAQAKCYLNTVHPHLAHKEFEKLRNLKTYNGYEVIHV